MSARVGQLNFLIQQAFCMIFTRCETIVETLRFSSSPTSNLQNPHLACLLREIVRSAAPIPVTRLWTPCTRLKIRGLQTQTFH
jgi:hypothetical protein